MVFAIGISALFPNFKEFLLEERRCAIKEQAGIQHVLVDRYAFVCIQQNGISKYWSQDHCILRKQAVRVKKMNLFHILQN